ncbi:MAG: hypothetical protein B6A08_19455 [Sorangiineae bacterium NIC37A_2]|jgi:hemerythrin-like domain-containing protein|nr:MAG: hypothetical protein B6A08_19455 [Sorangiineae bacterium NIC37A_2]
MLIQLSSSPRESTPKDLVDLLLECHGRIRQFVRLAREAGTNFEAPHEQIARACADVERYFAEALPLHVADEELSIEPRLRGLSPEVDRALDWMHVEHRSHELPLALLLGAAAEVQNDPKDRRARAALAQSACELDAAFEKHLAEEENVIFPAIRALLSPETQETLRDELRERRGEAMRARSKERKNVP